MNVPPPPGAGSAQIAAPDLRRHEDYARLPAREGVGGRVLAGFRVGAIATAVLAAGAGPASSRTPGRADRATRIPPSGLAGSLQSPCFSPDSKRIALTR